MREVVIPKAIEENGWEFFEKCRCSRILKYKFRHKNKPGMELEWWVKYYAFKVKDKGKTVVRQTPINKLDETLKGL